MRKVSYKTVLRDLYEDTDLQDLNIDAIYLTRLILKADKKVHANNNMKRLKNKDSCTPKYQPVTIRRATHVSFDRYP